MSRKFALPPEWTKAIREDALSMSSRGIARERIGISHKIWMVRKATIRIGSVSPSFWVGRSGHTNVIWLGRRPRCQNCGQLIEHNTKAVAYNYRRRGFGWGRACYIHEECP